MVCLYSAYFQEGIEGKVAFDEKEEERRIFLIRLFCVQCDRNLWILCHTSKI